MRAKANLVIKTVFVLTLMLMFTASSEMFAQTTEDMMEMSLDDLLDMEVTVASKKPMSIRETPGIVSVITEKEIVSSGANDLLMDSICLSGFTMF